MARLVDFCFEQVNAAFDALPIAKRLAIFALRFDEFVAGGGSMACGGGCGARVTEIGGVCAECRGWAREVDGDLLGGGEPR